MRISIFLYLVLFSLNSFGQVQSQVANSEKFHNRKSIQILKSFKNQKAVAITLNATLGYLGVHRMYLGTDVKCLCSILQPQVEVAFYGLSILAF